MKVITAGSAQPQHLVAGCVLVLQVCGPLDRTAEPEIVAIDPLGLGDLALIEEQRGQGMPGRMHPGPGFGVGQVAVELDGVTQVPERLSGPSRSQDRS